MHLHTLLVSALATTSSAYWIKVYTANNFRGTQHSYATNGAHSIGFTLKSWKWESTPGDGCCVRFCKNREDVGYYCGSASKRASTGGANKVITGCGSAVGDC